MRLRSPVVALAMFVAAGCAAVPPSCGSRPVTPRQPAVIRTPSVFGTITADRSRWTRRDVSTAARFVVGGRPIAVDARTERSGVCLPGAGTCAAWVGLRHDGPAAWVLIAQPARFGPYRGRLEIAPVLVWRVRESTLVLSSGIELRLARRLTSDLTRAKAYPHRSGLRLGVQGPQAPSVGKLYVQPGTGEVVDGFVGRVGCA